VLKLHAVKTCEDGGKAPYIRNLDTGWRRVASFTTWPRYAEDKFVGIHWTGGWVWPRTDVNGVAKTEIGNLITMSVKVWDLFHELKLYYSPGELGCHSQYSHYATGWTTRVRFPAGAGIVIPPLPDRLWSPPGPLSNGYRGSFPLGEVAESWRWPLTSR
jgi:hypothetical protein